MLHRIFTFGILTTCLFIPFFSTEAQNISGTINSYARVNAISSTTITVDDASEFESGNLVLIIQMTGNPNSSSGVNSGNYEFAIIASIVGNDIGVFEINRSYSPASKVVQLVRVPYYENVTIASAGITCPPYDWHTGKGGVLALYVCGIMTMNGDIDASAKGFSGSNRSSQDFTSPTNPNDIIDHGQGIDMAFTDITGLINTLSGGVGGGAGMNDMFGGGGGGGGGGVGGGGGGSGGSSGGGTGGGGVAGQGGLPGGLSFGPGENGENATGTGYFNAATNKIFMGGGGGYEAHKIAGGHGGQGGGIVCIYASIIEANNHTIEAEGGTSFFNCAITTGADQDHFGGGGGGQILLQCPVVNGNLTISAKGGNSESCSEWGGGGGGGGIWNAYPFAANVTVNIAGGISNEAELTWANKHRGGEGLVIEEGLALEMQGFCNCPPTNCNDGFCYTQDLIDIETCECINNPIPFDCDDGVCLTTDVLDSLTCICVHTPYTPDCDDGICYTEDGFSLALCECFHNEFVFPCDDGDCATLDTVNTVTCLCTHLPIPPPDCNDELCNTTDTYNSATCLCEHTPIEPPNCDDDFCGTTDTYNPVTCLCEYELVEPLNCNDNDCNTADVYNFETCICEHNPITPGACDDGLCSTTDNYDTNLCACVHVPVTPLDCNDNNCNTNDEYNPVTCLCDHQPIAPPNCDDNDPETTDVYQVQTCTCLHVPAEAKLIVPNAFSPDDNGINDEFRAHGNPVETFYMDIYNRWGQRVFESSDVEKGWDGRFKGQDQEMGIYVYRIHYRLVGSSEDKTIYGNLTLIR